MAIKVRTEAPTDTMAMKFENLQYNSPNGQSLFSMYTKLKMTYRKGKLRSEVSDEKDDAGVH